MAAATALLRAAGLLSSSRVSDARKRRDADATERGNDDNLGLKPLGLKAKADSKEKRRNAYATERSKNDANATERGNSGQGCVKLITRARARADAIAAVAELKVVDDTEFNNVVALLLCLGRGFDASTSVAAQCDIALKVLIEAVGKN